MRGEDQDPRSQERPEGAFREQFFDPGGLQAASAGTRATAGSPDCCSPHFLVLLQPQVGGVAGKESQPK